VERENRLGKEGKMSERRDRERERERELAGGREEAWQGEMARWREVGEGPRDGESE
jgi:hypothetical protein